MPIPDCQVKPQLLTQKAGDVGVTLITTEDGRVTGFSLIFPFEKFQDPNNAVHVRCYPPAFLLGRITNQSGLDFLNKLAATKNSDRPNFKFDLRFV